MDEFERMDLSQKEIFDYIMKKGNRQISYHEVHAAFPACDHVLAMMLIDEILEIKEVDDELVYMIAGSELPGLES